MDTNSGYAQIWDDIPFFPFPPSWVLIGNVIHCTVSIVRSWNGIEKYSIFMTTANEGPVCILKREGDNYILVCRSNTYETCISYPKQHKNYFPSGNEPITQSFKSYLNWLTDWLSYWCVLESTDKAFPISNF